MSTAALRAHLRMLEALGERIRTHHAPAPVARKGSPSESERMARVRNGRRTGKVARQRKPGPPA